MNLKGVIKDYDKFIEFKKGGLLSNIPPQIEEYNLYEDIMKDEEKKKTK